MADEPTVPHEFERWRQLASTDPEAFERERRRCIEEFIAKAPPARQERLRRLQWRIDRSRQKAKNPLGACIALSKMMWESVLGQNGLINALQGKTPKRAQAKIFPMQRNKSP